MGTMGYKAACAYVRDKLGVSMDADDAAREGLIGIIMPYHGYDPMDASYFDIAEAEEELAACGIAPGTELVARADAPACIHPGRKMQVTRISGGRAILDQDGYALLAGEIAEAFIVAGQGRQQGPEDSGKAGKMMESQARDARGPASSHATRRRQKDGC